jgi:hypothetical protein
VASTAEIVDRILDFGTSAPEQVNSAEVSRREQQLLDEDYWGIAVNAPRSIDTRQQNSLPVWVAVRLSGERDYKIPLKSNAVLVASNLEDGTVRSGLAFVSEKELNSRAGPRIPTRRGPPTTLALRAAQLRCVDARLHLGLPWQRGTWSLALIYHDWLSNTTRVELAGPAGKPPAPRTPFPAVGQEPLPSYRRFATTPPAPNRGLTFTLDPASQPTRRPSLKVSGAFRFTVRPFHLMVGVPAADAEAVRALVPLTLLITAIDFGPPLQFDWMIPVYGGPLADGASAEGCFAIDALQDTDSDTLAAGPYVSFAVLDGQVYGPQTFSVPA